MTFRGKSEALPTYQRGACQELFGNRSSAGLRGERRSVLAEPRERRWSSVTTRPTAALVTVYNSPPWAQLAGLCAWIGLGSWGHSLGGGS